MRARPWFLRKDRKTDSTSSQGPISAGFRVPQKEFLGAFYPRGLARQAGCAEPRPPRARALRARGSYSGERIQEASCPLVRASLVFREARLLTRGSLTSAPYQSPYVPRAHSRQKVAVTGARQTSSPSQHLSCAHTKEPAAVFRKRTPGSRRFLRNSRYATRWIGAHRKPSLLRGTAIVRGLDARFSGAPRGELRENDRPRARAQRERGGFSTSPPPASSAERE